MESLINPRSQGVYSRRTSARPSRAQGLTNANSFELTRKTVFTDKDILKSVLKFLDYDDLLRARLVNNFWNEIICTNPTPKPSETQQTVWPKIRLSFPKKPLKAQKGNPERAVQSVGNTLEAFENLPLVRKFHCPNYRFFRVDLRQEKVQLFFVTYGGFIRSLSLDNCIMSLVTFQRIINKCRYLESFSVAGLFHCITQTESLCATRDAITLCSFANLRKLGLESTYVRRMLLNLACQDSQKRYHVPVQELHPLVIHELLTSALHLKRIRVAGFGYGTILSIMDTLVNNPIHSKLTQLEFYDISNGMNADAFRDLARQLGHIKLRVFALTFLAGELQRGTPETFNMDSGIQEVIAYHGETLEELDLTHCHVTDKIFNMASNTVKLAKIKTLILKGTKICRLPKASLQLMESLDLDQVELNDAEMSVEDETRAMIELVARERHTQLLIQEHNDFGFKIFSSWDNMCFFALGTMFLVGLGQLLIEAFGESGKLIYILIAAVILTFVQHKRKS